MAFTARLVDAHIGSAKVGIGFVKDDITSHNSAFAVVPGEGDVVNFNGMCLAGSSSVRMNFHAYSCVGYCGDIMTRCIDMLVATSQIMNRRDVSTVY